MLTLDHVGKRFGDHVVFSDLHGTIPAGALHGIIGPNGTGKTTLFRLILGLMRPDEGAITWQGKPLAEDSLRMAYVPEERGIYPHMTVHQHLQWFGRLDGLSRTDAQATAAQWMERLALEPYRQTAAGDLSKGNGRKLQLALGLLVRPDVIILDEPFDGMDPPNIQRVQTILGDLHADGVTILLSGHNLDFLDQFCHSFTLLAGGRAVLHGPRAALQTVLPWQRLTVKGSPAGLAAVATWAHRHGLTPEKTLGCYRVPQGLALALGDIWSLGELTTVSLDPPRLADVYEHVYQESDRSGPDHEGVG